MSYFFWFHTTHDLDFDIKQLFKELSYGEKSEGTSEPLVLRLSQAVVKFGL